VAGAHAALLHDGAVRRIDFMAPGERPSLHFIPRDSIFLGPGTVGLNGQPVADWNWHWVKTNFPAAWDITRGSASVRVAVIDSEFDTEHADLKPKLAAGLNLDSGSPEYLTGNVRGTDFTASHGTHVAGLVGAATDNGNGVPGACFDCVVIPFKIGGTQPVVSGAPNIDAKFISDLTQALVEAAKTDAVAINMSLGTPRDHAPLRDAVNVARAAGKIVVASAGNSQQSNPGVANYPAAYDGVIAVAATMPTDDIAPFSTVGNFVDIAAPGHPVLSTWDSRITAQVAAQVGQPSLAPTHNVGFIAISGTSMASPIVAGLVALMKTVRPDLTEGEVLGLLQQSAVDLGANGKDPVFGAGRINAVAAVRAAVNYVRPPGAPPGVRIKTTIFWSGKFKARSARTGRLVTRTLLGARRRIGIVLGTQVALKGRTQPAFRRAELNVQRFAGRRGWTTFRKVRTNNRGRFGFLYRPTGRGNHTLRVLLPASSTHEAAISSPIRVRFVRRR
jgi:subtilisin family serine protease